jgi:hypothetical protein
VKENTNYYFDPANPISKSADANINKPILASLKIVAEEGENYLLKADELFFEAASAVINLMELIEGEEK